MNTPENVTIDTNKASTTDMERTRHLAQLIFEFNHTMPFTPRYEEILKEIFGSQMGEHCSIHSPISCTCAEMVRIGDRVVIRSNTLLMARGGITIEDGAIIASNVQLITVNHDMQDRSVLTCRPIHICRNAWIGAGATILPGVTVHENSVIGAASLVTHDVPANTVVAGNPAQFIKHIEGPVTAWYE